MEMEKAKTRENKPVSIYHVLLSEEITSLEQQTTFNHSYVTERRKKFIRTANHFKSFYMLLSEVTNS